MLQKRSRYSVLACFHPWWPDLKWAVASLKVPGTMRPAVCSDVGALIQGENLMKLATGLFVVGALISGTTLASAQGASNNAPGQQMQDKGSVNGSPGASGYAPGQQMQDKGSVSGTQGASGYAPGHTTGSNASGNSLPRRLSNSERKRPPWWRPLSSQAPPSFPMMPIRPVPEIGDWPVSAPGGLI